jgi:hypothetical protein
VRIDVEALPGRCDEASVWAERYLRFAVVFAGRLEWYPDRIRLHGEADGRKEKDEMSDASNEVSLTHPIEHEGKKITSLKLRRPIVADMLAAQKVSTNEPERELNLIATLIGLPRAAVEKLDLKDYLLLQQRLTQFMKQ